LAAEHHGVTRKQDRDAVARNLKLYVQQASELYEAGKAAKATTAPLIYYYSFLNLAKALCELRHPRFYEHPECYRHGVSWRANPKYVAKPESEVVSLTTRGVWHVLWESFARAKCPAANPTKLRIKELFSYCPEISVEIERAFGIGTQLLDLVNPDVVFDVTANEVWIKFSIERSDLRFYGISAPALIRQIQTSRSSYVEVRSANRELRTFESASAVRVGPKQDVLTSIYGDVCGFNVFTNLGPNNKLSYAVPLQSRLPLSLPQAMVLYTLLFWLGSVVRYDPYSVDAFMDLKYWHLIERFMSQSRLWLLELFEWALYQAETTLYQVR
jgi:hypothetical protein